MPSLPSFLHIADVHLDAPLRFFGGRGREHRANIRAALTRAVDVALERRVDAFLVAGDLFDSNRPGSGAINFVRRQFARLAEAGIAVRIVPGTHDALTPHGVYNSPEWAEIETAYQSAGADAGIHVYRGDGPGGWDVETLAAGLTIYARPTLEKGNSLPALADLPRHPAAVAGCEVALVHAAFDIGSNDEDDYVLYAADIVASGMAYVATGHWHRPRSVGQGQVEAWYPGSPEPVSLDPRERGAAMHVQLNAGQPARVEPVTIGRIEVRHLEWDVTGEEDATALENELLRHTGPDIVLRLTMQGRRDAGWTRTAADFEEAFGRSFFHLSVDDTAIDDLEPGARLERLDLGPGAERFAERIQQRLEQTVAPDDRRAASEALRLGLALLGGRDPW